MENLKLKEILGIEKNNKILTKIQLIIENEEFVEILKRRQQKLVLKQKKKLQHKYNTGGKGLEIEEKLTLV